MASESTLPLNGEPHNLGQPESVFLIHDHLHVAQNKLPFPPEQELYFQQHLLMTLLSHRGHQSMLYPVGLGTFLYIN